MKATYSKLLFLVMSILILTLAACSEESVSDGTTNNNNDDDVAFTNPQPDEDGAYDIDDFSSKVANDGEPIDGGEITQAIVSDSPFAGTLNPNFSSGTFDAQIIDWFGEDMLESDEDFKFTNDGLASFEFDKDEKSFTFTLNEDDVKWSDGEEFTMDDWKFAYEVIGHPEYDGPRYDSTLQNVKGMEEYHDGVKENENGGYQTIEEYREEHEETISGIEVIDDKTMKITYNNFTPSLISGGIWVNAMPKHVFENMNVKDMSASDAVRKEPIGLGPFKVDTITEGESVTLSPNEYYWRGEPNLDKVTLKLVDNSSIIKELENGTVDLATFPLNKYYEHDDMTNVQVLGLSNLAYEYIGFKLGSWDEENGVVVPDPDKKMADRDLREAMWYAVDTDEVGKQFSHGLQWYANTLIPPSHENYHGDSIEAPTFDPEKANEILDQAGYEWVDGEDFRTDPDGNELTINFAAVDWAESAEPIAKYYMQAWADVGLDVELLDGRMQEFEVFYDRVEKDDPDIDIFLGNWGVGTDIDPSQFFGKHALFNYPRYQSDENDALLEEGLSEDSFDIDHRIETYKKWQELMVKDIPVFPTLYEATLQAANTRITNYDIGYGSDTYLYELGVTEVKPAVNE